MALSSDFMYVSNFSAGMGVYIPQLTVIMIQMIIDKIILVIYAIVLISSVIQTFWKNKYIDRLFASMNEGYSDGKFRLNQVYFRKQIFKCYRFDERFSYIPNPNRSILFIIVTHIQILILIAMRTSIDKRSELVNDCSTFYDPYQILQCENNRDPCRFNDTETAPKCSYYYFEVNNVILTITSIITWHYSLRYLIVKLVRFIRWILFCDNDQPRRLCFCCQATPCILRCLMYLQYIMFWLYLFFVILCGFAWNISWFHMPMDLLGSAWMAILMTIDRLCALSLAFSPELIQNWLDATANGDVLRDLESKGLLLTNIEPLIHLTDKKTKTSFSIKG